MTPDEIKAINTKCQEYRWVIENIDAVNDLAELIANEDFTITLQLNIDGEIKDDNQKQIGLVEKIKTFVFPLHRAQSLHYNSQLTEDQTLQILGVLFGELMIRRNKLKDHLTKNGVTL